MTHILPFLEEFILPSNLDKIAKKHLKGIYIIINSTLFSKTKVISLVFSIFKDHLPYDFLSYDRYFNVRCGEHIDISPLKF